MNEPLTAPAAKPLTIQLEETSKQAPSLEMDWECQTDSLPQETAAMCVGVESMAGRHSCTQE